MDSWSKEEEERRSRAARRSSGERKGRGIGGDEREKRSRMATGGIVRERIGEREQKRDAKKYRLAS